MENQRQEERLQAIRNSWQAAMKATEETPHDPFFGWIITHDFIRCTEMGDRSQVGRVSRAWDEKAQAAATTKFRLYDDDGNLYYQGRLCDGDYADSQFDALRWGEAFAGCTTIKVQRDGKWEQDIG